MSIATPNLIEQNEMTFEDIEEILNHIDNFAVGESDNRGFGWTIYYIGHKNKEAATVLLESVARNLKESSRTGLVIWIAGDEIGLYRIVK